MKNLFKYTYLLALLVLTSTPSWADCFYPVNVTTNNIETSKGNVTIYENNFTNTYGATKIYIAYKTTASLASSVCKLDLQAYYNSSWHTIASKISAANKSGATYSKDLTGDEIKATGFRLVTTGTSIKNTFSATACNITLASTLSSDKDNLSFPELFVNGSSSKTATISFSNTGTTLSASSSSSDFQVSLDNSSIDCSGTRTLTITFCPTSEGQKTGTITVKAGSNTTTINVSGSAKAKATPVFTWDQAFSHTLYVGDNVSTILSSSNTENTVNYTISNFEPSGSNNEGAAAPSVDASGLHCSQAGTFTLTASQVASTNYLEKTESKTITVSKRPNAFTISLAGATAAANAFTMPYGAGAHVSIISNNSAKPFEVTQTAGADLATYYSAESDVYTSYKKGTATWSVSQAEDYKYEAAAATFAVTVAPAAESTCYLYEYTGDELSCSGFGDNRAIWNESGVAGTLTFKARHQLASVSPKITVYQVVNGAAEKLAELNDLGSASKDYSFELNPNASKVYFEGSGTLNKYVSEVRVSRKLFFTTSIEAAEGLRMPDCRLGETSNANFDILWSRPGTSHNIHISSDNDHFVVSPTNIPYVSCNHGTTNISVAYTPVQEGEETATLTIYDESQVITLDVHGKTVSKFTPEIDWLIPAVVKLNQSLVGLSNILTSTNSECPITITSSAPAIASYDAATQTLKTYDNEGFVTFTVSQTENPNWHPISVEFTVFVTDKENQMCVLAEETKLHKLNVYNTAGSDGKFSLNFDAPASLVKFNAFKEGAATDAIDIEWFDSQNTKLGSKSIKVANLTTSRNKFVIALPREARKVSFDANGTLFKYVDDVQVYRAQYLEHNAILTDGKINFGSADYQAEATIREFDIFYSGAGEMKVSSSNDDLFTIEAINETIDCANALGTKHITIAYNHQQVSNEHTATLNAQLGTMVFAIPLVGATNRPHEAIFIGNEDDDWTNPNNWEGGVMPADNADITIRGELVIDHGENRIIETLIIEETGSVLVVDNGTLTINGGGASASGNYGDLTVGSKGNIVLNIGADETLNVNNFYILSDYVSSDQAKSGLVGNPEKIDVQGDAYMRLSLDKSGQAQYGWYAFSVPFAVNLSDGVFAIRGGVKTPMKNGVDFKIQRYDEARRAAGQYGWVRENGSLQPGTMYIITVDDEVVQNTFLFRAAGKSLQAQTEIPVQVSAGDDTNRGWNGIGNSTFGYVNLPAGTKLQIYNFEGQCYDQREANEVSLVVGSAAFVQAEAAGNITLTQTNTPGALRAPMREATTIDECRIKLLSEEGEELDRLYISASEEATDSYTIGHDLLKMGASTRKAQLWCSAYGEQLCDAELPLLSGRASFPLTFFSPAEGNYTLTADALPEDATLYLTSNNRVIWNLSMADYDLSLTNGQEQQYGLMLVYTPQAGITTSLDAVHAENSARKVLIDNIIYIVLPDGSMRDTQGKMIK